MGARARGFLLRGPGGRGVWGSGVREARGLWGSGVWEAGGLVVQGSGAWGPGDPGSGGLGPAALTPLVIAGAGASGYALIDVAATEAAHRAGAQHAQAREERLPAPEQRPKAAPR